VNTVLYVALNINKNGKRGERKGERRESPQSRKEETGVFKCNF
jgi:hypothetical protein